MYKAFIIHFYPPPIPSIVSFTPPHGLVRQVFPPNPQRGTNDLSEVKILLSSLDG